MNLARVIGVVLLGLSGVGTVGLALGVLGLAVWVGYQWLGFLWGSSGILARRDTSFRHGEFSDAPDTCSWGRTYDLR